MNIDTNEVITAEEMERRTKMIDELESDVCDPFHGSEDFKQLPASLQHAAKVALKGKQSTFISKNSGGKLSRWANQQRKR